MQQKSTQKILLFSVAAQKVEKIKVLCKTLVVGVLLVIALIFTAIAKGWIDESYCGDNDQWYFPALAMRDTEIHVNDRICQFRIMEHQPELVFEETEVLTGKDRGGFGTTGRQ